MHYSIWHIISSPIFHIQFGLKLINERWRAMKPGAYCGLVILTILLIWMLYYASTIKQVDKCMQTLSPPRINKSTKLTAGWPYISGKNPKRGKSQLSCIA
jgi:hypothetical protein